MTNIKYTPAFRNSAGTIITGFASITMSCPEAHEAVASLMSNAPEGTNPVFVAMHNGLQWVEMPEMEVAA
jgi:hypothetical protein